jgi:prepilin-type N-terminal cleavage/methylation domain-containing protein
MIRKLRPNNEKGFTLIELMIVVAIIGILAAIAIPQFSAYRERSYIASMKADCNAVRTAEEAYFVDNDTYLEIAAATDNPSALPGMGKLSAGNKVAVTASTGTGESIANTFVVTVTSDKLTSTTAKVNYNSTTGETKYTP